MCGSGGAASVGAYRQARFLRGSAVIMANDLGQTPDTAECGGRPAIGVTNEISVAPPVSLESVKAAIEEPSGASQRPTRSTSGSRFPITPRGFYGHVHTLQEANAVRAAAAAAAGVAPVEGHLAVAP